MTLTKKIYMEKVFLLKIKLSSESDAGSKVNAGRKIRAVKKIERSKKNRVSAFLTYGGRSFYTRNTIFTGLFTNMYSEIYKKIYLHMYNGARGRAEKTVVLKKIRET